MEKFTNQGWFKQTSVIGNQGKQFFSSMGNKNGLGKYIVMSQSTGRGKGTFGLLSMTAALGLGYYLNLQNSSAQAAQKKKFVFAWGAGNYGQLGIGSEIVNKNIPTEITAFQDEDLVQITSYSDVSAALTAGGQVFIWGKTKATSLEHTTVQNDKMIAPLTNLSLPTPLEASGILFSRVACGKTHNAAITINGKLLSWGDPDAGKLGHTKKELSADEKKSQASEYKKHGYNPRSLPNQKNQIDFVQGELTDKVVVDVACGHYHTGCVTSNGEVYTWGNGKNGALGHGNWDQVDIPKKVEGLTNIVKIECGNDYTICMDKDGKLYSFGANRYGQLGILGPNVSKPSIVNLPHTVTKVIDFALGEDHSALITDKGEVYTWGLNLDGQLGHQDRANLSQPTKINFDHKVSKIACGGGHTGLITADHKLFMFGRGRDGQLGRGGENESNTYRAQPKQVTELEKEGLLVEDISLGYNHCIALAVKKI